MSAADERGMMVSFIQSNYMGFGSGVVVPNMGISLQNRGCGFSMDPKSANLVEGGKCPFHTIISAFLTQQVNGAQEAVMSFCVMGGDMQCSRRGICNPSCACSTTASSRRPPATRRAGR